VDDVRYWLGFNRVKGIGPVHLRTLIQHFGGVRAAWNASPAALQGAGLEPRILAVLLATREAMDLDAALQAVERAGAWLLPSDDSRYPPLLREIHDPPPLLYVKGTLTEADRRALAVVGSRNATDYGRTMTQRLVEPLACAGMTIISGLAHGIDSIAHLTALQASGRTIAVLPCGIDRLYPQDNRDLANAIIANGALVSELPLGTSPDRWHFPPRNRIVSGLSLGALVVEAGAKSGALITAHQALEQGREVFAVPGSALSELSTGANGLIRDGAIPVEHAGQILEALSLPMRVDVPSLLPAPVTRRAPTPAPIPAPIRAPIDPVPSLPVETSPIEAKLLAALSGEPQHIDELARASGLPIDQATGALTLLELKSLARQVGVLTYVCAARDR
jgi:DNA processing protein